MFITLHSANQSVNIGGVVTASHRHYIYVFQGKSYAISDERTRFVVMDKMLTTHSVDGNVVAAAAHGIIFATGLAPVVATKVILALSVMYVWGRR